MDELEWLRERVAGMVDSPWEVEKNDSEEECLYGPNGEWLALFPHQCVASLEERATLHAEAVATLRNVAAELLEVAEQADRIVKLFELLRLRLDWKEHNGLLDAINALTAAIRREMKRER